MPYNYGPFLTVFDVILVIKTGQNGSVNADLRPGVSTDWPKRHFSVNTSSVTDMPDCHWVTTSFYRYFSHFDRFYAILAVLTQLVGSESGYKHG